MLAEKNVNSVWVKWRLYEGGQDLWELALQAKGRQRRPAGCQRGALCCLWMVLWYPAGSFAPFRGRGPLLPAAAGNHDQGDGDAQGAGGEQQ